MRNQPITDVKNDKNDLSSFDAALKAAAEAFIINNAVKPGTKREKEVREFLNKVIDKYRSQIAIEKSAALREQVDITPWSVFTKPFRLEGVEFPHPIDWTEKQIKSVASIFKKKPSNPQLLQRKAGGS